MEIPPVTVQLTSKDMQAFTNFCGGWPRYVNRVLPIVILSVVLGAPAACFYHLIKLDNQERLEKLAHPQAHQATQTAPPSLEGLWWTPLFLAAILLLRWQIRRRRTRLETAKQPPPEKSPTMLYWISERGIHHENEASDGTLKWMGVTKIGETDEHIFFMRAKRLGVVIPKRCFPSLEAAGAFASQARTYHAGQGKAPA